MSLNKCRDPHPDDRMLLDQLQLIARAVADRVDGVRPSVIAHTWKCHGRAIEGWGQPGFVTLLLRWKLDSGKWANYRRPLREILDLLAHELGHTHSHFWESKNGRRDIHGPKFRAAETKIRVAMYAILKCGHTWEGAQLPKVDGRKYRAAGKPKKKPQLNAEEKSAAAKQARRDKAAKRRVTAHAKLAEWTKKHALAERKLLEWTRLAARLDRAAAKAAGEIPREEGPKRHA